MAKKTQATAVSPKDMTIEEKLRALYDLQLVDSRIDRIRTIRGELPLEVQDLEDEIVGMETRAEKMKEELASIDAEIAARKNSIKDSQTLIKKYEQQQANVRNNREFDSLSKEIEYQNLEIQLAEKRIKENKVKIEMVKKNIEEMGKKLSERKEDLKHKKDELGDIIAETEKEEKQLQAKSAEFETYIEERYLSAYKRIRANSFNRLAVVTIERDSCGGCYNKIPPQRQIDIAQRKKILVCEHCGRVLVDEIMATEESDKVAKLIK
ncbi:MAG: C4-type zinc ribbon domain-containing protein [Flavobacteriales bacterium]|nr:C4-type zinc ribbon domain-containing protein [Flavobacteriales bacterium]